MFGKCRVTSIHLMKKLCKTVDADVIEKVGG
jgi:hypothetical protein